MCSPDPTSELEEWEDWEDPTERMPLAPRGRVDGGDLDEICAKGINQQQCKGQQKSIFTPLKQTMTQESLDMLMSLYEEFKVVTDDLRGSCLLYTSPSPRDKRQSRMPSSA